MRFLDELELYLSEGKDKYDLYPVDYDIESGVSFGVKSGSGDELGVVKIKTIDGVPIDALGGNYDYKDVYADVEVKGDIDDPSKIELLTWLAKKLINLGYDENTLRIDGREVFKKSEDLEKDTEEPTDTDTEETDFSDYWKDDESSVDTFDSNTSEDEEEDEKSLKK